MALATADVKAVDAELSRLGRLVEDGHPWSEVMTEVGYLGALVLELAPTAETLLERHAVATVLMAIGAAAMSASVRG